MSDENRNTTFEVVIRSIDDGCVENETRRKVYVESSEHRGEPQEIASVLSDAVIMHLSFRDWAASFARSLLHEMGDYMNADGREGWTRSVCLSVLSDLDKVEAELSTKA